MLLPLFCSSALFCTDDIYTYITHALMSIGTGVANAVTTKIIEAVYQTPDQKVINTEAQARLKFLAARDKFSKCAEDSKPGSAKNNKGIPIECKELAHTFVACGGMDELIKIITDLEELGD